jgi:tetratricopeptide (TPR) repeat protein
VSAEGAGRWLGRLSASLRDHEEKRNAFQNLPPRYEVLEELSRGGMGIVYRAWDPQLGREVALKILRPEEGASAEIHERFSREGRLAASLHHPHIVPVYDTGTWKGQDYIAMQLVQGKTFDKATLDRRAALGAVRDAARALHYAHEQGVVHRDVKPSNLLLDSQGRVFVTDFGVARKIELSGRLTVPGTVVGTPLYMSPEQARGETADARSDVYSLGATLYELVTGRPPYPGKDASEILGELRAGEPVPPRRVLPSLSRNVEAIILGAMERAPEERYPSAAAFADDVDRYLANQRPLRRPRGLGYRVRRQFVRHPWRTGAALASCALLVLACVFLGYFLRAYVALRQGRQAADLPPQKYYFGIAEPWFREAADAMAKIREHEHQVALENAREADRRRKQEEDRRREEEERRKLEELQKSKNESDQEAAIARTAEAARKHVDEGKLEAADDDVRWLRDHAAGKYAELTSLLERAHFTHEVGVLESLASEGKEEAFLPIYRRLEGPTYESVAERSSRLSRAVFALARVLWRKKCLETSVTWFDEAEKLGVREATLNEERGLALIELQQWERAEADFGALLARTPADSPIAKGFSGLPYRRGNAALLQHHWEDAIRQFAICLRIDPDHAMAHHDRGIARFRSLGLAREALEEDLTKALAQMPALKPAPDYKEIVLAYSRTATEQHWKDELWPERRAVWERAVYWLSRILELVSADDRDLLLARSRMRRRLGEIEAAGVDAEKADRLRSDFESRLCLGMLAFLGGEGQIKDTGRASLARAIDHFTRASQEAPKDPSSLYWRGICHRALANGKPRAPRELDGALGDFNAARSLKLDGPHLYLELARTRLDLIERDKNNAAWQEAAGDAALAIQKAELLNEEEWIAASFEQRRISLSRAAQLLERDAHLTRGQAFEKGEIHEKAIEECSLALKIDDEFGSAHLWKGYALFNLKRFSEAQEEFRKTVQLTPDPGEKDIASRWLNYSRYPWDCPHSGGPSATGRLVRAVAGSPSPRPRAGRRTSPPASSAARADLLGNTQSHRPLFSHGQHHHRGESRSPWRAQPGRRSANHPRI